MGMASGENGIYFGTDVACRRGNNFFSTACVFTQNAQLFVVSSNIGENHENKFRPPDATSKLALGCWPIHLSTVTCHSKGERGRYGIHWWHGVCTVQTLPHDFMKVTRLQFHNIISDLSEGILPYPQSQCQAEH